MSGPAIKKLEEVKVKFMNQYSYNVPVVSHELPPAESLHQVFDNLKYLDEVITDVFARVSNRIGAEKAKISNVVQRVANCQVRAFMIIHIFSYVCIC
jgi:hypothetical protein